MEDVSPPEACHAMLTHLGELQCSQSGAGYSSTCSSQKLSVAVVRTIRNVGYLNIRKSSPKLMPQSRYQAGLLALHQPRAAVRSAGSTFIADSHNLLRRRRRP
jgi:hypothetical protein